MRGSTQFLQPWIWVGLVMAQGMAGAGTEYERDPINYWKVPLSDPVSQLKTKLDRGEIHLDASSEESWLRAILFALDVPASSQVLVFSKTSLQRSRIAPETPRALYFNDEVYVGWVPGGAIELSAIDPQAGPVFYLLERPLAGNPVIFERPQECLTCHAGAMTKDVPGYMTRSVFADAAGAPILSAGTKLTGHQSPLDQRWGGWYVTGTHTPMQHMGNTIATETPGGAAFITDPGSNRSSLRDLFDVSRYLLDQSDIVALMVLDHQVNLHTLFARAQMSVRTALYRDAALQETLRPGTGSGVAESTRRLIDAEARQVVKNLLFTDEVRLAAEGVSSNSPFLDDFTSKAPKDHLGQSLKTLHLGSRLFKNRCSYLIYSRSFDNLPVQLREQIASLLREALAGNDEKHLAAHLSPQEKERIVQILRETKPELAGTW